MESKQKLSPFYYVTYIQCRSLLRRTAWKWACRQSQHIHISDYRLAFVWWIECQSLMISLNPFSYHSELMDSGYISSACSSVEWKMMKLKLIFVQWYSWYYFSCLKNQQKYSNILHFNICKKTWKAAILGKSFALCLLFRYPQRTIIKGFAKINYYSASWVNITIFELCRKLEQVDSECGWNAARNDTGQAIFKYICLRRFLLNYLYLPSIKIDAKDGQQLWLVYLWRLGYIQNPWFAINTELKRI